MVSCPKCGTQLPYGTSFCSNCGAAISAAPESAPSETSSQTPEAATTSEPVPNPAPNPEPVPAPTPAPAPDYSKSNYQLPPEGAYSQPYQQTYYGDPSDHTLEFAPEEVAEYKLFAVCAYLLSFAGIIIALLVDKDSPYLRFHIKQALRLTIAEMLALIPAIIPVLGWAVMLLLLVVLLVIEIVAIVWAFQGKSKDLPVIKSIGWLN